MTETTSSLFFQLLDSSRLEQLPVTLYFHSGSITGIVSKVGHDLIELRTENGKHAFVAADRIEAVIVEK